MKITKLFCLFFLLPLFFNAQDLKEKIFISAGYTYFNRSFEDVGVKYLIDEKAITLGANTLIGFSNNKLFIIPEVNFTKYFNSDDFPFPFARISISTKTVTPQFGISMLFMDFGVGYGISLGEATNYNTQGFRAQVNFNIPLKFKIKLY